MTIEVGCAYGFGPDVAVNIQRDPRSVAAYPDPLFVPLDFTAAEARALAARLIAAAEEVESWDREVAAYFEGKHEG